MGQGECSASPCGRDGACGRSASTPSAAPTPADTGGPADACVRSPPTTTIADTGGMADLVQADAADVVVDDLPNRTGQEGLARAAKANPPLNVEVGPRREQAQRGSFGERQRQEAARAEPQEVFEEARTKKAG